MAATQPSVFPTSTACSSDESENPYKLEFRKYLTAVVLP